MNVKKLCFMLAMLLALLPVLSACAGNENIGDNSGANGERGEDGSWDNVTFNDKEICVEVSARQDEEVTFPATDIYTKGPDQATTDEVHKMVLERNARVQTELGIKVHYRESHCQVLEVFEHIQKYVQGSAEDSPDVIDNDIYGLVRAMMAGYLWNVADPGADANGNTVYSYLDLEKEGWYTDYMKGATFDPQKIYILAGDYHIDLIRFAWVLFTNVDDFNEVYSTTEYGNYDEFCEYLTETNDFFYSDLVTLARKGWRDDGNEKNETDFEDSQIGLCLNANAPRIFLFGCGHSMVDWSGGSFGEGTPSVFAADSEGANVLAQVSQRYTELFNGAGVHYIDTILESTTEFFKGNIIFTMSVLGEMESQQMRGTNFQRGIVPFPRYSTAAPDYCTVVHDQAEISCILNNTASFSAVTAYLQFINENSADVLEEYYERSLKFKYNENKTVRTMIEFVKEHIVSPFDSVMALYLCDVSSQKKQLYSILQEQAIEQSNGFASSYAKYASTYELALRESLEKMEKIP